MQRDYCCRVPLALMSAHECAQTCGHKKQEQHELELSEPVALVLMPECMCTGEGAMKLWDAPWRKCPY